MCTGTAEPRCARVWRAVSAVDDVVAVALFEKAMPAPVCQTQAVAASQQKATKVHVSV